MIRGIRKDETDPFPGIGSGTEKWLSGRGEDRRQFLLVVISSCPLACFPVITKLPASWWKRDDLLEKALHFDMKAQPGITRMASDQTCLDPMQKWRAPRYRGWQPLDHAFGRQLRLVRRSYPNSNRDVLEGQWRTDPDLQTSCLQIRDVRVAWQYLHRCRFKIRRLDDFELQSVKVSAVGWFDHVQPDVGSEGFPVNATDSKQLTGDGRAIKEQFGAGPDALSGQYGEAGKKSV
ncbi:hypothetical protein IX56_06360 [Paracoccus sanguinis]|uniref:Uncharacterized protein n=1 Tax=Paracoccus sanguinis TaxID=1545044 RepID=A0A099GJ42_9RHOB|nr:hypothetical protein IX56_06360 [Paracoccus sanguinis]